MTIHDVRRWFRRTPPEAAPQARPTVPRAEDEVRELLFGGPPPAPASEEPAWIDRTPPAASPRRPFLEITAAELEAYGRTEDPLAPRPSTRPGPLAAFLRALTAPWRATHDDLRLALLAIGALVVVFGVFVPFFAEAVNAAFATGTGP